MRTPFFLAFLSTFTLRTCSVAVETNEQSTNNWGVIVQTSRYWYNYRHSANALSFYRTLKRLGVPDDHIILMLAEDIPCNARNPLPGTVFNDGRHTIDLYGSEVEVDFRGNEVSVEQFIRLLTGRQSPWTPRGKRLLTDANSHIFVFMTGHGGDEFLKFQDWEEISSQDIGDAFQQMWRQRRYKRIFFSSDTCQASTLQNRFSSPRIIAVGSSKKGQNSYSHHSDEDVGVPIIDRFTYHSLLYFERLRSWANDSLKDYFDSLDPKLLASDAEVRDDLFDLPLEETRITDFLGSSWTHTLKFIHSPFCILPEGEGVPKSRRFPKRLDFEHPPFTFIDILDEFPIPSKRDVSGIGPKIGTGSAVGIGRGDVPVVELLALLAGLFGLLCVGAVVF